MKEEMSPFFSVVAELAGSRGFEVTDVNEGALTLNLNGEFAAMVDETGAMNYHPYKEVFDMMDEVLKIRAEIPYDNSEEGMQLDMRQTGIQEEIMRRLVMCKSSVTRKKNQKSKYLSGYALTGILLCGKCGQEYRRVTWARNGRKKIVWRCSNRLTNGVKKCGDFEALEEGALNRAVMEAIHRITKNEGDFVGAFRQNVIRVIGSYGREQQPDEYTGRIKAKQEEMVALIAENAKAGAYTQEFDERYRRIAEEINALKEEQAEAGKKLAENYEQRVKDMGAFLSGNSGQIPEFDNDLVRWLVASIKVIMADRVQIQFQSGIVME